jgi:capsular polysaccharide biosynthesis protein
LSSKINLKDLGRLLINNIIFILIIAVICTGIGYGLSHFVMQKAFTATTSLVVTTKTSKSASSERDVYQEILRNNQFLKKAKNTLNLTMSTNQLIDNVSINMDEADVDKSSSHTYWLTVGGNDEQQCKRTAIYLSQKIKPELLKLKEVESVKSYGHNQVSIVQTAPHYKVITLTWGIVGLLVPIIVILFSWLYDGSFKRSTDIEETLDLPVYGIIPSEESAEKVDGKRKDKRS